MEERILKSDLKCIPVQKMIFDTMMGGMPVNSFEPRFAPGEQMREDGVRYVNDICFGDVYPNSYLDIYYAPESFEKKRPTVIYIHGGGFLFGDKATGDPLAIASGKDASLFAELAGRGYNVVSPNYALAPEYRFQAQMKQMDQMLKFLSENQEKFGLDMAHVFLGGGSAGADMAEIYGVMLVNPEYAEKAGVKPSIRKEQISGLLLDEAALSVRNFEENMNAMLGCWLGMDDPSENKEAEMLMDAVKWIGDEYIPSFINSSNMEIWFKDSADDLAAALEANGTEYEYFYRGRECGELGHGYMSGYADNPYARECLEHMVAFMERRMK